MADIRFVTKKPGVAQGGKLYINGQEIDGVLSIEPRLFQENELATVTVVLAVSSLVFDRGNDG